MSRNQTVTGRAAAAEVDRDRWCRDVLLRELCAGPRTSSELNLSQFHYRGYGAAKRRAVLERLKSEGLVTSAPERTGCQQRWIETWRITDAGRGVMAS